ncbi:MAG: FAD binding domain-containing protein [Desulfobacterales bacterium]|nr:FAD binding domain-containing protein [Desulfobacterales bacterium]
MTVKFKDNQVFELKEFIAAESLDQADELLHQDKKNVILGGLLWMRMGTRQFNTGIDLSGLGLHRITDRGDIIEIGAMTPLRQLETNALLAENFGPVLRDAVSHIVGVQFRNLATVGGSVFSRFSFSDVITALLVLDTRVHLFRGGEIPMADFLETSPGRDILVKLTIPKQTDPTHPMETAYVCHRKSAADFPVLAAALARTGGAWRISVGARPSRAKLAVQTAGLLSGTPDMSQIDAAGKAIVNELTFGSNAQGSKAYREHLAKVLIKRGIQEICN